MMLSTLVLYVLLIVYLLGGVFLLFFVILNKANDNKELKMINCPDCGKKISINANICKHCNSEILKNKELVKESVVSNNRKKNYKLKLMLLIIYQLIFGLSIAIGYEKINEMIPQVLLLVSLIINTISLIIFIIKNIKVKVSVIAILATICGLVFIVNYSIVLSEHIKIGYNDEIREILYLDIYDKEEAEELLDSIYTALYHDKRLDKGTCISLKGIWEDETKDDTFVVNLREDCKSLYFPPNAMKIKVDSNNKVKVDKIYWDFNDDVDIVLYENNKRVDEFSYLYYAMLYEDQVPDPIKEDFEKSVKEYLKSPSSSTFTYNDFKYSPSENRFLYEGWVESQNSFGAIVKTEFELKLMPCNNDYCEWYNLDYSWKFR